MRRRSGFQLIQYRETDWAFIRRLASRFGMAVYPETTLGGGKLTVDLPQTGNAGELSCLGYTARIDRKFYQAGGEQEGRSREQYQTYEVRSMELRRVGDAVTWDGKHLFVCARKAELRDGMLEFVYILSGREWTWQKRLGNPKISGMSLLGTVEGCSGETVRLLLDIDRGRPAQLSYPWTWVPATGNLMYLMPQVGTRVSLYFKGEEETDAIAVNCIRSGDGCAQADYRDKSLTTEHGMQLRLNQGDMGIVSLKEKLLLDDMEGIRIAGSGSLHILAAGEVKIAASEVRVAGTGGVLLYEGTAEADREGNIVVAPQGKIELSAEDGERAIHNRGKEVTYYLAWEHEDLSHPSNRYRDAPQQKDYDWMKLGTHVAAGLMIAGGIAALAAGGVLLLGAAAATAIKIGMTVFLAGSLYVGEQALSDIRSGRVSDLDQYTRKAVAGSVVGFLTGASGLLMAEASLWGVLALGFGEGLVGSIVTQKLLNEDGEIDWGVAIAEAGFSAVTAGFAWKEGRSVRGVGGGSEADARGLMYDVNGNYTGGRTKAELDALADDPAHMGSRRQIDIDKGVHEQKVGLGVEESGKIKGPIIRDPSGKAEFFDADGQAWDVKSFNSKYKPRQGGFTLQGAMRSINKSLSEGEYVIIDTTNLNAEHLSELLAELERQNLTDKIILWP